jgi:tetratricopeptide (TPR) repeat protein
MRTITFYSYKGGVGRTLALANIAKRLCEFNKRVCVIDFDLEAPGIPSKFPSDINPHSIKNGIVDYIHQYFVEGTLPASILDYCVHFDIASNKTPMYLIPAGNVDSRDYWKKLSSINWYELLYESGTGLKFFLDLKAKIKAQINPDFLLIDSRTGISEMSGITISILADQVVVLAVNNRENIDGAKKVLESLMRSGQALQKKLDTVLVLSRIPFTSSPNDRSKEQFFLAQIKSKFAKIYNDEVLIIHSDRELEEKESLKIEGSFDEENTTISNDYLKLFGKLTERFLTRAEIKRFLDIKEANRLYGLSLEKDSPLEQIEMLTLAIQLNSENTSFFVSRGKAYERMKAMEMALDDFQSALKIEPNNIEVLMAAAEALFNMKRFDESKKYVDKVISIDPYIHSAYFRRALLHENLNQYDLMIKDYEKAIELYPNYSNAYNNIADFYRLKGNFKKAKNYVYKSLSADPENGVAYATLAEINAALSNIDDFYLNFELALKNANNIEEDKDDIEKSILEEKIYQQFFKEERFLNLLRKYNISFPSHFPESD